MLLLVALASDVGIHFVACPSTRQIHSNDIEWDTGVCVYVCLFLCFVTNGSAVHLVSFAFCSFHLLMLSIILILV